jgi:hypothetical protein
LKLKRDELLSSLAFKFNWRRYNEADDAAYEKEVAKTAGSHWSDKVWCCRLTLLNPC